MMLLDWCKTKRELVAERAGLERMVADLQADKRRAERDRDHLAKELISERSARETAQRALERCHSARNALEADRDDMNRELLRLRARSAGTK